MSTLELIDQELAKAAMGLNEGNEGLARVCARRAVALGVEDWIERSGEKEWPVDAMNRLRTIQAGEVFPLAVREAAQRLLTAITQQTHSPMTSDPIGDARLILANLGQQTEENAQS